MCFLKDSWVIHQGEERCDNNYGEKEDFNLTNLILELKFLAGKVKYESFRFLILVTQFKL